MKNIKIYLTFTIVLISLHSKAQEINYLTITEYNNILIDGVKWSDIININGDVLKMKNLFNVNINYNTDSEPSPNIGFWYNGVEFEFEDNLGNGNYTLTYFSINNYTSNISIKGNTFTIGDTINKIGRAISTTYNDNSRGYIFAAINSDSSSFSIKFDPNTNIITEIEYFDFN